MFSFNTPATRALPHMPFPDITKVYGRGYTNVRDSIRAYKPPVLSMKTQEQVNKEIISNAAGHRIRWSESEVKRAIKTGWDGGDTEDRVASSGGGGVGESKGSEGESEYGSDYEVDSDYEEEEEKGVDAPPRDLIPETREETVNPVAEAHERFVAAGFSRYDVPKDEEGLKVFMKTMRDSKIVQINYSGRSDVDANRRRLFDKLGIHGSIRRESF